MARRLSLTTLALTVTLGVSGSALPGVSSGMKPSLLGSRPTSGRFNMDAVKIDNGGFTLRPRTSNNTANVGSDWYIQTWIGTPPKPFYLLVDSGAPNLSIESTLAPKEKQGDSPMYDPAQSSTAQQLPGYTYAECYGSGYCDNGVVINDVFTIGHVGLANMPLLVRTNNNERATGIRTGNLGMNFDKKGMTTKPHRLPTYFESLIPFLEAPLWTVDWHASTRTGQFQFGYIDSSKYVGDIAWGFVVTQDGEWMIEVQGVQAGYADADLNKVKFRVMIDTGSGGGTISREIANLYWRSVPNARYDAFWDNFLYPCNQTLPDFVIQLPNGKKVGIPDEGLRWDEAGNGLCLTNLALGTTNDVLWGDRFIQRYFVIFDWGNQMVGLAKKRTQ